MIKAKLIVYKAATDVYYTIARSAQSTFSY